MSFSEPAEPYEWVEIDGLGVLVGKTFTGTFPELRAHLLRDLPEGTVGGPDHAGVYVRHLATRIPCPLVTLKTPWSSTRWIPAPPRTPPRVRHAWLLRR